MEILAYFKPFGIDLFCLGRKFLVLNMVSRNIKIKYRRSFLGLFWTLLSPMAMAFVYYFVFKVIMKIQVPHYLVFILSGVLPWSFFNQSVVEGLESMVGNSSLIAKVPVPIQAFPLIGTLTNLVTLGFAIPILIGAAILSHVGLGPSLIMLLYFFFALFLISYALSLILGIFFVYFRDLRHLISIVMQLWFYATPIFYDIDMIPKRFYWVLYANPVGTLFVAMHTILLQGKWCSFETVAVTAAWSVALTLAALYIYLRLANDVAEYL